MNANVNDDFTQRTLVHSGELTWEESPMFGVRRRRLDRVVKDMERVTTVVEYAENSAFSTHEHPGGEEILVLDGVFEDSYGTWPKGSYVRNPPGSIHTPHSAHGCTLLVKLCQFDPEDKTFVHTNINHLDYIEPSNRPGVSVASLFKNSRESVRIERWQPDARIEFVSEGGAELFVIEGTATENDDHLQPQSWLRVPVGGKVCAVAGSDGTQVWIKTNHLKYL